MLHVTQAKYIADHRVHIWFNDGTSGEIDFAAVLGGGVVFEPLRDVDYFKRYCLEGHTLTWDNGADFAPEYLHGLVQAHSVA